MKKLLSRINPFRLSLLSQFSILSLALFLAIGAALGWGLTQHFEQEALRQQQFTASNLMVPAVSPYITKDILAKGAYGKDYQAISNAFSYIGGVGLVRIKIWNRDGMVVYSDDPNLVGKIYPKSSDLLTALSGAPQADISTLNKAENVAERGYGELLEVYTPLKFPGENGVSGALEGYFDIDDLRMRINETNRLLWSSILGGFLFLYISLFAIVRGASQRLITQSRENSLLLVDTQRKAARLQTINELARFINQPSLDLDEVFGTALRGIDRIVQHNGAGIFLLDERTGAVSRRVSSHAPSPDAAATMERAAPEGPPYLLASIDPETEKRLLSLEGVLLCSDTRRSHDAMTAALGEWGIRSFLAVPIYLGDRTLGTLLVVSGQPNAFDEDDGAILSGVTDQLAVAIENTRLLKETAETTALLETNRLKDEFVSMVSHELRTPLASIKGYSHTLMADDGHWDAETRDEFLSIIADESDKLTDLVENLLEMSRIGAGRLPVAPEPILLSRFCKSVVGRVAKQYPQIEFECELTDPLPVVEADPRRVEQVLVNLLQNAAKYSGSAVVRVDGRYDGGSEVVLSVQDYGKGIPSQYLPHLFDKFYRVDDGRGGKEVGTGLGLAIAKALVEIQGGRIWVESTLDEGTVFFFSLPTLILRGEGVDGRQESKERIPAASGS